VLAGITFYVAVTIGSLDEGLVTLRALIRPLLAMCLLVVDHVA